MTPNTQIHGARCVVNVFDPTFGAPRPVGIYTSISFSFQYDVTPAFILGRFSAASLTYVAVEPVQVTCNGWRVIDHGAHVEGRMPNVKDLMTAPYLQIQVLDKVPPYKPLATIRDCRATGYSTGMTARQLSEMGVSYVGLMVSDESLQQSESANAADLP